MAYLQQITRRSRANLRQSKNAQTNGSARRRRPRKLAEGTEQLEVRRLLAATASGVYGMAHDGGTFIVAEASSPPDRDSTASDLLDALRSVRRQRFASAHVDAAAVPNYVDRAGDEVPNQPPRVQSRLDHVFAEEDATSIVVPLFPAFQDAEDRDDELLLRVSTITNPNLIESHGIDSETGELEVELKANASGVSTVIVQATDRDGASVSQVFIIHVRAVNDAPTANSEITISVGSGQAAVFTAEQLGLSDVDGSLEDLTITVTGGLHHGQVTAAKPLAVYYALGGGAGAARNTGNRTWNWGIESVGYQKAIFDRLHDHYVNDGIRNFLLWMPFANSAGESPLDFDGAVEIQDAIRRGQVDAATAARIDPAAYTAALRTFLVKHPEAQVRSYIGSLPHDPDMIALRNRPAAWKARAEAALAPILNATPEPELRARNGIIFDDINGGRYDGDGSQGLPQNYVPSAAEGSLEQAFIASVRSRGFTVGLEPHPWHDPRFAWGNSYEQVVTFDHWYGCTFCVGNKPAITGNVWVIQDFNGPETPAESIDRLLADPLVDVVAVHARHLRATNQQRLSADTRSRRSFGYAELARGAVTYFHDGLDTRGDLIELTVTDAAGASTKVRVNIRVDG